MHIDPDIEEQTRKLLRHAIRGELKEMVCLADSLGDERYVACITWCVFISGYIGIDVSEGWPTEADLREIARHAAETTHKYELDASAVFDFLSRMVFGSERLDQVFPDLEVAATLPVLATARIIVSFRAPDPDKHWYEYLDDIWGGYEVAAGLNPAVLPALMFSIRRKLALPGRSGNDEQRVLAEPRSRQEYGLDMHASESIRASEALGHDDPTEAVAHRAAEGQGRSSERVSDAEGDLRRRIADLQSKNVKLASTLQVLEERLERLENSSRNQSAPGHRREPPKPSSR
jgi:hypothetical protein